jgi:hypothetical protein
MDDVLAGKIVCSGDFGHSRLTSMERSAFREQLWASSAVDGAVDTASAK